MPLRRACLILFIAPLCLAVMGCATTKTCPGVPGEQHAASLTQEIQVTMTLKYLLYIPKDYSKSSEKWPLVLFLHGAGERGDDLEKVKTHGIPKLVAQGKSLPFIAVSPQCPEDAWWSDDLRCGMLSALLDQVEKTCNVDLDRVYVTGLSMGGFGAWRLGAEHPERFAALAPICGGGKTEDAPTLAKVPIWAFHGGKDTVVALEESQKMVDAIKAAGGDVQLTVYPEAGHDSWTETYDNPAFYEWLLSHKRGGE